MSSSTILGIILSILVIIGMTYIVTVMTYEEPKLGQRPYCDCCSWQHGEDDWKYCMAIMLYVHGCPYNDDKGLPKGEEDE